MSAITSSGVINYGETQCYYWQEWEDGEEYLSYQHFNQDAVELADAMEEAEALGGLTPGSSLDQVLTGIFNGLFGNVALGNIWAGDVVTYPPVSDVTRGTPWWKILTRQLLLLLMLQMEGSTPPDSDLYRVVGAEEYASVIACRCFAALAGQQDIKQFWKNPVDATWYAEEGMRIFYPNGILTEPRYLLKIRVPNTIIATGYHGTEPGTVFGWVSFSGPSLEALNIALASRPISLLFVFPSE